MTREDLDELLNVVLPFAQRMLGESGEFYPFGAVLTMDGKSRMISGFADADHPPSDRVIDLLVSQVREGAQRKEFRATALCSDVRIRHPDSGEETDAIEVRLEDRDGDALDVFVPYQEEESDCYVYGELLAMHAIPRVFGAR